MNNVQTAIQAIRNIDTSQELDQLVEAFKLQRTYLSKVAVRAFGVGDNVSFGTVKKVNIKYVVVNTQAGQYRVPATMLTKQEA
jgi:hypothetical protein